MKDYTEHVIQRLTQIADTFDDTVECLLNKYDQLRLIHQAHIRAIMGVPSLKEGNIKENRCLHDVILQQYRELKAINEDNFETLLTIIVELKLDSTTMRDWQRSSQKHREVPPFEDLLDFLDLQECDTENSVCDVVKNILQHQVLEKGRLNPAQPAWRIVVWHARKTTIHFMGASDTLRYHLTREWSLSATVVYA